MSNFSISDLDYNKDYSIYELISLQDNEKVILLIDTTSFSSYHSLVTVSKNGYIKKTAVKEYSTRSKKGTNAVKLEDNDILIGVYLSSNEEDKIFIASNVGNYNYYPLSEISCTGKLTKGVKAIKLGPNDYVQSATIFKKNIEYRGLLTITCSGKGKITKFDDFNVTSRCIKGSQVMSIKDDKLAAIYAVPASQDKIFISANNKAILLDVNTIPIQNKNTTGISIIKAGKDNLNIEIL
jgi:DNA gyrase subunit A